MKKTYLLIAFVAATVAASAQEIISWTGRKPQMIPGELTADGKSRMYFKVTSNEGGDLFYIYNENMELETTLEVPSITCSETYRVETATVPGTGTWSYDSSNAEWSLESEETIDVSGKVYSFDSFYNMDKGSYMEDCDIYVTQTLFNNDENWEFVIVSGSSNSSYVWGTDYDENTGTVSIKRSSTIVNGGARVYNQHGELVTTLDDPAVDALWIANGKKYVTTRTQTGASEYINKVYLINGSGSNSGKVSQVRGDVNNDGTVGMPDAMFIVNKMLKGKFPDE